MVAPIVVPSKPPFGTTVLWGKRKCGKTLAALNSPWAPVHIIDIEDSSADYETHMLRLIEMGIIHDKFTRADCPTYASVGQEFLRIVGTEKAPSKIHYGTIVIDTVGQLSSWIGENEFAKPNAQSMSQVTWGRIRDRLRNMLIQLSAHCDYVVLCAHERVYNNVYSPRANPAILELASISIRLNREANVPIPDGTIDVARLPFFPPRIPKFTITKLLDYIQKPANWEKLNEEEKATPESTTASPEFNEEASYSS